MCRFESNLATSPMQSLTERQQSYLDHSRQCAASGLSLKDYAQQHGLNVAAFYEARKRLRRKGLIGAQDMAVHFARAEVCEVPAPVLCRVCFPAGYVVEIAGAIRGDSLRQVLAAVDALV